MLESPHIEVLLDVKTKLGEGPLWDAESQRLYWIDSADGRIFRATQDGCELRSWDVGEAIGSMAVSRDGSYFLAALRTGLYRIDVSSGHRELVVDPEPELPNNRLNDGKVDRQGRFVFGSMDTLEEQATGRLYSYTPDGQLNTLDSGIVVSNGPCFSPNGRTLYFSDTWTGKSGPTTTTRPTDRRPTAAPLPPSTPAPAVPPMAQPSTPRATCGRHLYTAERSFATTPTARWIASSKPRS